MTHEFLIQFVIKLNSVENVVGYFNILISYNGLLCEKIHPETYRLW
jgi:hypothetical protein